MTASDDEYDAQTGGPIELTEQDCATIDALSVGPRDYPTSRNVPRTDIVGDANETRQRPVLTIAKEPPLSPIERYRPSGRLSVSDLVSPAWCEVQFEYGLLQRRSWRLDKRPGAFVSREGKQIHVKQKTAQLNDIVLQEGNAVHFALEREVHPAKVEVTTTTLEEYWGLRLLNMISDLHTLMLIGKCREFRVMGFIHDHFISGIIDEINCIPIPKGSLGSFPHKKRTRDASTPSTPSKPKSKRNKSGQEPSSPEKQLKINSFFPVIPGKSARPTGSPVHIDDTAVAENLSVHGGNGQEDPPRHKTQVLHIIDSKTRLSPSLPQDSATLSSRLQLMTYKRLLDALLTPVPPFDFTKLWRHLGLDPARVFSEGFINQMLLISPTEEYDVKCVKDVEKCWWSTMWELGVGVGVGEQNVDSGASVDPELTLVYRLRGPGPRQQRKNNSRATPPVPSSESSEQKDLQRTILESFHGGKKGRGEQGEDTVSACTVESTPRMVTSETQGSVVSSEMDGRANALDSQKPEETLDPELQWALQESLKTVDEFTLPGAQQHAIYESSSESIMPNADTQKEVGCAITNRPIKAGDIIGYKRFKHDDLLLDSHITSILAWWHGEREPRGVEVEESYRCHTCEYMEGCEWRERKVFEGRGSINTGDNHSQSLQSGSKNKLYG